ncbi:MAG TPA: hypothetical protein VL727_21530 [Puia sp.]|nr:hypothetical protein [Puia sp.]
MMAPIIFYKNLYHTYNTLDLPVGNIDPSTAFTIKRPGVALS